MRRTTAAAATLVVLATSFAVPGQAQIPGRLRRVLEGAGNVARTLLPISTSKEVEIGRGIAATIAGRYPVSTDTALTIYVNLVGLAVAGEAPRPDIDYRFAVLETPDVNAFAAPGGYIFITRGALDLIESEAELAAVLAHEVGHVNRRHVIEQIRRSDAMRAVRSETGLEGSQLDRVIGGGANVLFMGLSRTDEAEADSIGVELAYAAGYDPGGLAAFVSRLESHGAENRLLELRASHPAPQLRLETIQRVIRNRGFSGGETLADRLRNFVPRRGG
ncbi:MAG TPA: M48 family metalloprotease [Gemmatimonadales bacterium]|nr:M48 family metalloprotease [Gemmatimonadales bacterium]